VAQPPQGLDLGEGDRASMCLRWGWCVQVHASSWGPRGCMCVHVHASVFMCQHVCLCVGDSGLLMAAVWEACSAPP
jgi:hypothetical protein